MPIKKKTFMQINAEVQHIAYAVQNIVCLNKFFMMDQTMIMILS